MFDDINDRLAQLERLKAETAAMSEDTARRRSALWGQERAAKREQRREPDEVIRKDYDRTDAEVSATNATAWAVWVDARINAAVAREREFTMDVLAQSLAGFMDEERDSITKEVELKTAEIKLDLITKLETAIATMRKMLGDPIAADLPPLPRRTSVN
jgi:hypothetical protein